MKLFVIATFTFSSHLALHAQGCGFSHGKTLAELQIAIYGKVTPRPSTVLFRIAPKIESGEKETFPESPVFLPRWSANDLPFFCKIEHDWGKSSKLPLKFRLGSIDYVDWLEGK